jgi:flagellar basal-body rod modification protein FlgD
MQIFSNPVGVSPLKAMQPEDTGSSGTGSSSSSSANSATVSANDFLQLLVTELKNQDPTANTDPNEYINQLVQVNSLEQLISINQDLAPLSESGNNGGSGDAVTAPSGSQASGAAAAQSGAAATPATGNLSAPGTDGAASRVASALGTAAQTLAPGAAGNPYDAVLSSIRARAQQAAPSTSTPAR